VTDKPAKEPEDRNTVMKRKREICEACESLKDERCSLISCPSAPWFRSHCPVSKWIDPLAEILQRS